MAEKRRYVVPLGDLPRPHDGHFHDATLSVQAHSSPMSSFQRSGCEAMNSSIIRTHLGVVHHDDFDTVRPKQVLGAKEGPVLPDHHLWDLIEKDRPGAHRAGGERGVDRRAPVVGGLETSGVLQSVHLPVEDRTPLLHPLVVAPPDDLTVDNQHRPDRDPALGSGPRSASAMAASRKGSATEAMVRLRGRSHSSAVSPRAKRRTRERIVPRAPFAPLSRGEGRMWLHSHRGDSQAPSFRTA